MALMKGTEHFSINNKEIDLTIYNFWSWAYSDFFDRNLRSTLAKYIVASALKLETSDMPLFKSTGKAYNLLTAEGYMIDVHSAAYIESLESEYPNHISFRMSQYESSEKDARIRKLSNIHIFSVYKGMKKDDSPLNLSIWEFYILPSEKLDKEISNRRVITLQSLIQLDPLECDYHGIDKTVRTIINA